ncbi:MAG: AMP-binding protein [Lachnospiraceae bacterium]|nr:AMP-binding protein [Lachnospiraceae bacterium]
MNISKLDQWVRDKEGQKSLTRQEIERIQLFKLNTLLAREKQRNGFYKHLPERLEHLSQISMLPFTTEEDLNLHGHRMVLLSQSQIDRVRTQETSGTTGPVKRVYYSESDNERTISFFAAGLSELVYPGEKTMICMPFSGYRGLGELIAEAIVRLDAIPLAVGIGKTYGELLQVLDKEQPETFVGMPVPLLSMLRMRPDSSLLRALVSADACPKTVMQKIEERLGSRLYPHYGSREIGLGGAVTCPAFEGTHVRENDLIVEIVDQDGRVLPRGKWGELVVTTIQAEAMPLIRYRTGDYTRVLPEDCPCGSKLNRLDRIVRLGEKSLMKELDDRLFQHEQIIDYRVCQKDGVLNIDGYTKGSCKELPSVLEGYPVQYTWSAVSKNNAPCYIAKRSVQSL